MAGPGPFSLAVTQWENSLCYNDYMILNPSTKTPSLKMGPDINRRNEGPASSLRMSLRQGGGGREGPDLRIVAAEAHLTFFAISVWLAVKDRVG